MITFEQYELWSYAAAIGSGVVILIRGAYLYLKHQETKLLNRYRVPYVKLNTEEMAHYNELLSTIDSTLEILCKPPVTDVFPKSLTPSPIIGTFDFVICSRKEGKIKAIFDFRENITTDKITACKKFRITLTVLTKQRHKKTETEPFTKRESNKAVRKRYIKTDPFSHREKRRQKKAILKI